MTDYTPDHLRLLLAARDEVPSSHQAFDDGGAYRIEIASVEGPAAMTAVLDEADARNVLVHRVSQGSGITLLADSEIVDMARLGRERNVEVCLFVGPRGPWEGSGSPLAPDGKYFGWRHTSLAQLQHAFSDVVRAVELGIRSVLVADEGLIALIGQARQDGHLPPELIVKVSAMIGVANPLGAKSLENLGADTINVASDAGIGELAAFRAACHAALDIYIEGPDGLGGFVRYHDVAEIVRVAAPVHLKFGLRNAPNIYPSGAHLQAAAEATGRERVRRASLAIEALNRSGSVAKPSPTGRMRPGVPVP
jgi:hypothetical protein